MEFSDDGSIKLVRGRKSLFFVSPQKIAKNHSRVFQSPKTPAQKDRESKNRDLRLWISLIKPWTENPIA